MMEKGKQEFVIEKNLMEMSEMVGGVEDDMQDLKDQLRKPLDEINSSVEECHHVRCTK